MINVRELRIGNIVNDDTNLAQEIGCKVVGIVESISEENIELKYLRSDGDTFYGEEHPINLSPIPLTEELLLRCGFEWDKYNKSFFNKEFKPFITKNDGSKWWRINVSKSLFKEEYDNKLYLTSEVEYTVSNKPIDNLHQLQNIYFALTGKELEVSL